MARRNVKTRSNNYDEDRRKPFQSERIEGKGNLTRDPLLISGKNAKMDVVVLNVAANSLSYDKDGNEVERVTYRDLKVLGYDATLALQTLQKGDEIHYRGRLSPKEYEDKHGEIVESEEVLIDFDGITITLRAASKMLDGKKPAKQSAPRKGAGTKRQSKKLGAASSRKREPEPEYDDDDTFEDDDYFDDEDEDAIAGSLEDEETPKPRRSRSSRTKSRGKVDIDDDVDLYTTRM